MDFIKVSPNLSIVLFSFFFIIVICGKFMNSLCWQFAFIIELEAIEVKNLTLQVVNIDGGQVSLVQIHIEKSLSKHLFE